MSGRCCLGQDDGNGIWRAANSGVAVTGDHAGIQPGALPGPARPKASDSQSKGAQNAQIGAIWTLIDVEHVQKQIEAALRRCHQRRLRSAIAGCPPAPARAVAAASRNRAKSAPDTRAGKPPLAAS